jgi:DNA repair protein RecO (recombination protein O)
MLTDTLGRQTYMVQGVKSSRGHGNKAALLQPMFVLDLEGIDSPRAQMHRIREMRSALPLRSIPFDVRKSTVALFMAEMLYRLVREVEPNSPLFDFVYGSIETLDAMTEGVANFHLWFMVALARHLGFFPGNEYSPRHRFDIREGLFAPGVPAHGMVFSQENSDLLGVLMDIYVNTKETPSNLGGSLPESMEKMQAIKLNRTQRSDFLNAMLVYFGYHLDATRDIRSVDILREVF